MSDVPANEIQINPRKHLSQVEVGETLIIFKFNKPIAELKPVANSKQLRPFGLCAGEFIVPDDFDASLPEDILNKF